MEQGHDQEPTGFAAVPTPTGVATEDYFLPFTVPHGLMPDRQFDGRPASLQVHRVRPVYATGQRPTVRQAVVLIHGRTVTGPVVFDLRASDQNGDLLSVQEALARAGIDTFAPSLLGYGGSTRFDEGLNDPGNASRRPYPDPPDSPCQFPEGCDRNNPLITINPLNQQQRLLPAGTSPAGKPLFFRRAHSSNFHFARTDVWVRDIDQVIDDAIERARPTDRKVALVGYSAGGQHVGRTLYANNNNQQLLQANDGLEAGLHIRANVIEKVSRVVFVNSLFGGLTEELDPLGLPTFPLTLEDRAASDALWTRPATSTAVCNGRILLSTQQKVWDQNMENDTMGRAWGPTPWLGSGTSTDGLNRAPTFSGYGWNADVAGQLSTPTLVMQGLEDGILPTPPGPATGPAIFNSLKVAENKVLVKVACASHALPWEGCDGVGCKPPHATLKEALIEWIRKGKFNNHANGSFTVNEKGQVTSP